MNQGNDNQNGAAWNLGSGYGISHQAPIGWVYTDNTKFAEYRSKILTLAKEGQEVSAATGLFTAGTSTNIYLQGADLTDISNADQYKYPDGKVWVVKDDDLKVSSDITYHGVGTIIIYSKTPKSNDLQIIAGAKLRPANPATDRLGIIILDESTATRHACILGSGAEIRAQILCDGTTTVSGNLKFTGAISSWKFSISNPNSSINFAYDPSVAEIEPPGFRDLAIPNASEVGNR